MKTVWKIVLILLQAALLVFTGNFGLTANQKYKSEVDKNSYLESSIDDLNKEIEYHKIRLNDSIEVLATRTEAVYLKAENYKTLYENELKTAKKLNAKLNELNGQMSIITHVSDTVYVPTIIELDKSLTAKYSDGYIDLDCNLSNESSRIAYHYSDSLLIFDIHKQHSILWGLIKWKSKKNRIEAFTRNPKAIISDLQVIKIIE